MRTQSIIALLLTACIIPVTKVGYDYWNALTAKPSISVHYDETACPSTGKFFVNIENASNKPLSFYEYTIRIYMFERSTPYETLTLRSDHIVRPNSSRTFCTDISNSLANSLFLGKNHPGADPVELSRIYGDKWTTMTTADRSMFRDAVFNVVVDRYKYGLPY